LAVPSIHVGRYLCNGFSWLLLLGGKDSEGASYWYPILALSCLRLGNQYGRGGARLLTSQIRFGRSADRSSHGTDSGDEDEGEDPDPSGAAELDAAEDCNCCRSRSSTRSAADGGSAVVLVSWDGSLSVNVRIGPFTTNRAESASCGAFSKRARRRTAVESCVEPVMLLIRWTMLPFGVVNECQLETTEDGGYYDRR
jgi:hypothetical protein